MFSVKKLKINTRYVIRSNISYPLKINKIILNIQYNKANKIETIHYDDPMHSQK
jgi:hypothetical protein